MTKIVLLTRSLDIGGAEIQLVNLAVGLTNQGLNIRVAEFYGGGILESRLKRLGVSVISLKKMGRWDFIVFGFKFFRLVYSFQPDIIYSFLTGPNLCAAIGKIAYPKVRLFWGARASAPDQTLRSADRFVKVAFRLAKQISMIPEKIILNSNSSFNYHVKTGFKRNKLVVIPNGIDLTRYRYCPDDGQAIRLSLGIEQDAFLIGIVARLDPIKGHDTFLQAAGQFIAKYHKIKFVVVGSGEPSYERRLKELGKAMGLEGCLLWIDQTNELVGIYNALDIYTLTSRSESFPNTLGEAMACGTPCVSTDVGDCRSIVGDTGIIVKADDVGGLVSAWETIYFRRDKREHQKPCQSAISRIATRYSLETMVERSIIEFGIDRQS
mgnify:CR=1 FL=1